MAQTNVKRKTLQHIIAVLLILCLLFCNVVTVFATATSLRMNVSSVTVQPSGTYQLTAIVTPSSTRLSWKSDNPNVATVNANGVVTGKNAGTAKITCTANDGSGLSASCIVTVAKMISSISLSASSITIYTGSSQTVTASISPADATTKDLLWSSSNTDVATVSDGIITGKSAGTAVITCIAKDGSKKSAKCTVTVKQGVTSIQLNKTNATLGVGNTIQLTANVLPNNASNKSVVWFSTNSSVASVSTTGQVKGVGAGTATIICQSNDGTGIKAQCSVTVSTVAKPPSDGGNTTKPPEPTKPNKTSEQSTTPLLPQDETTEPDRETVTFSDEELSEVIEDVFGTGQSESTNNDENGENGEVTYTIDELLCVEMVQKKRKKPIVVSWNEIQGFSGYEVYVAVGEKGQEFQDSDYTLVSSGETNFLSVSSYQFRKKYSVKVRAYLTDAETSEKQYSDFSTPIECVSKRQGLFEKIKMFFSEKGER